MPGRTASGLMRCGQFTRCIHVSPIILEAAGFPEPKMGDGIAQEPMDGTSFEFSFDDPAAPERHTMQHFEMWGIGLSRPMDAG